MVKHSKDVFFIMEFVLFCSVVEHRKCGEAVHLSYLSSCDLLPAGGEKRVSPVSEFVFLNKRPTVMG